MRQVLMDSAFEAQAAAIRFCNDIKDGKAMLQLGLKFAKEIYGAKTVSLGVFENNQSAYYCYKAVGFQDVVLEKAETYTVLGEEWKCLELEMNL